MYKLGVNLSIRPNDEDWVDTLFPGNSMEYEIYSVPDSEGYLIGVSHEDVGLTTWYVSHNDLGGLIDEICSFGDDDKED